MAKGNAQIEISASSSRLAAGLSAAYSKFQSFAGSVARGMGAAFKKVNKAFAPGDVMKGALGHVGGDLIGRGMDAVVGAANDVRDFERSLTRLGIATGQTPAQLNGLRSAINDLSRDTAISREEILAATSNYVDLTGDVAGAKTAMTTFARVAQASGSSMSDVSSAAAALGDALQIKPEDLEATFSGLINQGKAGAVTLKDFAGELAGLAPKVARFKGLMGKEGAIQLGAAFQVARKGFGSASQAATGLEALMGALALNAKKFEAQGVKIFDRHKDGTKTFKNLHDIIVSIGKSKLAKDPTLLNKAFGSKEAEAAFNQLNRLGPLYDQIAEAGRDAGVVQRDLATYMESDAGRLDKAFNGLKVAIVEAFTPERIAGFVNAVESLASKLEPVVGMIGKAGDVLGGLYHAGQSIRGWFAGEANPYAQDEARANMMAEDGWVPGLGVDNSPEAMAARRAKNADARARARGFRTARDEIMGGEVNERTSKESIKRAVINAWSGDWKANDPEAEARRLAGSMYLDKAGVKPNEAAEVYGQALAAELAKVAASQLGQAIRDGFASVQPTTLKIGDEQVARANDRSTDVRRRPHP